MKILRVSVIIILILVALNALVAGMLFMTDPSGNALDMSTVNLQYSPFADYFFPGLILFIANGLLNLLAAVGAILKWKVYPSIIFIQGIILLAWIITQIVFLREINLLQCVFITIGILLIVSSVRLNNRITT